MEFIKWFLVGYLAIGFFFACIGVMAINSDRDIQIQVRKDGDPQSVPYWVSLVFLFLMVFVAWPLLIAKAKIRRDG